MSTPNPSDLAGKIILQGIHVDLTPALQNAIREKLSPLFRHDERIIRIDVRLHREQTLGTEHLFRAAAQIEISGPDLNASAEDKDAYVALDALVEKLDRLLEARHGRRKDRRNHPHGVEIDSAPLPKTDDLR